MVNILNDDRSSGDDEIKYIETKEFHYRHLAYNVKKFPVERVYNGYGFYIKKINSTSMIELINITSDNKISGLHNEILRLFIQVIHSTDRDRHFIYWLGDIDLTSIKRITYKDGGGGKYLLPIDLTYELNKISNYGTIELIGFAFDIANSAYTKGNSITATIKYTQYY